MKALLASLGIALGCGGGHGHGATPTPPAAPAEAPGFTATRWVPAKATYAISSHSVADAQHVLRDVVDSFGFLADLSESKLSRDLSKLLGVDPLSIEALRTVGVDPEGGFALFSDDLDPTLAVHLSAPDALPAFFDKLHGQGMVSQSVIVDGVEIFSSSLGGGAAIAWIVQGDWLLVHFVLPGAHDDGKSWVAASTRRTSATWLEAWQWANRVGERVAKSPKVLGFLDLRKLIATSARGADTIACVQALSPIERVGFAYDTDGRGVTGRVTFELGAAASGIAAAVLPDPPGWAAASANAPIAAQWNIDLARFAAWVSPCAGALSASRDLDDLRKTGVRSARLFVSALDIANTSGAGAVSLDVSSTHLVTELLDKIPMRSTIERDRTWHGVAGHHIGIPFGPAVDYVLDDKHALAAMGDGVIDAVLAPSGAPVTPLVQLDITPGGLSRQVWEQLASNLPLGRMFLATLSAWHDGHVTLALEGTTLVLEARGNRR